MQQQLNLDYFTGVKETLNSDDMYLFNYSYEYLDMARHFDDSDYLEKTAQYLKEKYGSNQPDFMVLQEDSLPFFSQYRAIVFPGVPAVIACSDGSIAQADADLNTIYISPVNASKKNIDLIMQLRPETRKIYIVIGDSGPERNMISAIKESEADWAGKLSLSILTRCPMI